MSVPKIMALRMGVYTVLIGYLICDLFIFNGPLHSTLNTSPRDTEAIIAEAKASGIVARVYYRPIYRAQVEEAIREYLWRRGRTPDQPGPDERHLLRELVLQQLIDQELIKLQIKVANAEDVAVPAEKIAAAVAEEKDRYLDPRIFDELANRARWAGSKEREMRLAARLQRADYLEQWVPDDVTEEEARAWHQQNKEIFPASFPDAKASIIEALSLRKRDDMWKAFRYLKLRHYAEGKIDLFRDVLHVEESE